MTKMRNQDGLQFLSVSDASQKLGISRLRLREAAARGLIPSKKDNEGRLRLDLTEILERESQLEGGTTLPAEALLDMLFDEVEELQGEIGARDKQIEALSDLAGRQAEALDRAEAALAKVETQNTELHGLLDRALEHLDTDITARERLKGLSERALTLLEGTGNQLEDSLQQTARFEALLERALYMAEAAGTASDKDALALGVTADRALTLLDEALAQVEGQEATGRRAEDLLGRALAAGEQLERDLAERDAVIAKQETTMEAALAVSERAVALASGAQANGERRSFWRRLLGI